MSVQEGHQYPNVTRVLKPDGGTDITSEWWYYDNGGAYPWVKPDLLSWTAPTARADGSALVLIDYYTVDYGAIGAALTSTQTSGLSFDIPNRVPGATYRARMSATDTDGKTSQLSGFVYYMEPA